MLFRKQSLKGIRLKIHVGAEARDVPAPLAEVSFRSGWFVSGGLEPRPRWTLVEFPLAD